MTLDAAKATAIGMCSRFAADFCVFRLPAWPADVYLVKRRDELPGGAEIAETFTASASTTAPARPASGGQGDLFT
jgi:hypothetical protein